MCIAVHIMGFLYFCLNTCTNTKRLPAILAAHHNPDLSLLGLKSHIHAVLSMIDVARASPVVELASANQMNDSLTSKAPSLLMPT